MMPAFIVCIGKQLSEQSNLHYIPNINNRMIKGIKGFPYVQLIWPGRPKWTTRLLLDSDIYYSFLHFEK